LIFGIEYREILKLKIDLETLVQMPLTMLYLQIICLCISIIFYVATFLKKGKTGYAGKFIAFLFLLFEILITAGIFFTVLWFWPPLDGLIFIVVWFFVSFGLTYSIMRRARKSE